ncbi:hypothetical protein [Legionella maceachernii]|uniref:Uncharacterized protein n=2 Tax=Legionella maceachernii TaxID=466 RepID=A0A0W0VXX6_9GAMM|nr:hypothetical protein [Legionella maceachernii]KTD25156.1 hypothetical protein Lmac_2134 [Legionella maceachernii]SKA27230.1 hypothetical protein SAMN02745128_02953 [Legionella maceachernii]SUP04598.1 Uncharacterised protein [Legionella maceachernii]
MGNIRLTVHPLSRNDIAILANLFEASFDYYIHHNSPFFIDYLRNLRTLIGLGYTAILADGALLSVYQRYLDNFIEQKIGNFRERQQNKLLIALSTAEMIGSAVISFSALKFPQYYDDFIEALYYTIVRNPEIIDYKKDAERIFNQLKGSRW